MPRAATLHAAGREAAKRACRPKLPSPLSQSILTCTLAHLLAALGGSTWRDSGPMPPACARRCVRQPYLRLHACAMNPAEALHIPHALGGRALVPPPWHGRARAARECFGPLARRAQGGRALVLAALAVADAVVHERGGHAAPVRALEVRTLRRGARVGAARRRGRRAHAMARTGQPGGLGESAAGARAGSESRSAHRPRLPGPSAGARAQRAPRGRCTRAAEPPGDRVRRWGRDVVRGPAARGGGGAPAPSTPRCRARRCRWRSRRSRR